MDSLFVRQAPKRGRVCLMLGASLLLHGGLIGIAAMWLQPQPKEYPPPMEWFEPGPTGETPAGPPLVTTIAPPETPEATATPEIVDKPEATPPQPESSPDILEMATPPPPRQLSSARSLKTSRESNVRPTSRLPNGQSNDNPLGASNPGPAAPAGAWVMPHPPYPHISTMANRPTGSTVVRITTDSTGRVSNVVILKSAGSSFLDSQTESFVRMNWHGPPNAGRTTEFIYQLK